MFIYEEIGIFKMDVCIFDGILVLRIVVFFWLFVLNWDLKGWEVIMFLYEGVVFGFLEFGVVSLIFVFYIYELWNVVLNMGLGFFEIWCFDDW